jgi:predicted transcriptional regulator
MENNPFFNPSPLYKEFMLLDVIEKQPSITQRAMSQSLNVAVSMINSYLSEYEEKGFLIRKYQSAKIVEYEVTKDGKERRKLLNIWYLDASQRIYAAAKNNIQKFLSTFKNKNYKNIALYGAGEFTQIILDTIQKDFKDEVFIQVIIDDDVLKQGTYLNGLPIKSLDSIYIDSIDGILVSSYTHHQVMLQKLKDHAVKPSKIIQFF